MKKRTCCSAAAVFLCVAWSAAAEEPARKSEPAQAKESVQATEPAEKIAETKPEAETTEVFKPPPGFRARKRGDAVLYCRKEIPLGSRFPAEKCYDEAGIRELRSRPNWSESIKACGKGGCTTP